MLLELNAADADELRRLWFCTDSFSAFAVWGWSASDPKLCEVPHVRKQQVAATRVRNRKVAVANRTANVLETKNFSVIRN